eukprot:10310793-Karenia_brevis.AAC.1
MPGQPLLPWRTGMLCRGLASCWMWLPQCAGRNGLWDCLAENRAAATLDQVMARLSRRPVAEEVRLRLLRQFGKEGSAFQLDQRCAATS